MGDTVVKSVKDATIWLGEVTVLPSDDASVSSRLKYGLERLTLGLLDPESSPRQAVKKQSSDSDEQGFQELHPGLAKVFGQRRLRKVNKKRQEAGERLASEFEATEKLEEEEAKDRGDEIAEDEHHYRRMLLKQIRRVYADSAAPTPKKYTYEEWAYFLRLLGEDESDSRHHLQVFTGRKRKHKKQSAPPTELTVDGRGGQMDILPPNQSDDPDSEDVVKWSWIGSRSPLMGDKEESEWLLEKLFQRMEESMRGHQEAQDIAVNETRAQRDQGSDQETTRGNGAESSETEQATKSSEKS
jgi:potassium channel subfamily K, other eukaryote